MTDISGADVDGLQGWLKKADRRLRTVEGSIMKGRIPRVCTSGTRPDVTKFQPGVRLFEVDTLRSIVATADGWIYDDPTAATAIPPTTADPTVMARVPSTINGTTDWNTLTTRGGIYQVAGLGANAPAGAYAYGTLEVLLGAGNSVTQRYSGQNVNSVQFVRTKFNEADWTVWSRMATAADIAQPTAADPTILARASYLGPAVDWNTLTTRAGAYRIDGGGVNSPAGSYGYGVLEVILGGGEAVTQRYSTHNAGAPLYVRTKYNTADWTDWRRMATINDVPASQTRESSTNFEWFNGCSSRNNRMIAHRLGGMVTLNIAILTGGSNLGSDTSLCRIPDGWRPNASYPPEGPAYAFANASPGVTAGIAQLYAQADTSGLLVFGRMLANGGGHSTTLPASTVVVATLSYLQA